MPQANIDANRLRFHLSYQASGSERNLQYDANTCYFIQLFIFNLNVILGNSSPRLLTCGEWGGSDEFI